MYVFDYSFISSFVVCTTPSLLSLHILTALSWFPKMFRWKTVGISYAASLYLLPESHGSKNPTYRCCPDDLRYHLVFFSTFDRRSGNCPSAGQRSVLG